MQLKPFKELIAMTKEKLDEAMAPIRARQVKAQAELKMSELDAEIITTETKVNELVAKKEIDFDELMDALDDPAMLERRREQYNDVLSQLFPTEAAQS